MSSFTSGTKLFGILLLLFVCSTANSSFDLKKLLDEDTFKKCSQIECSNPDLLDEQEECFQKLSERDRAIFIDNAAECYGIPNIRDMEIREFMKYYCSDIPRAYKCEKQGIEKFLAEEHSDEEKALLLEYSECSLSLYGPCMD